MERLNTKLFRTTIFIISFAFLTAKYSSANANNCPRIWSSNPSDPNEEIIELEHYTYMWSELSKKGRTKFYFHKPSRHYFLTHEVDARKADHPNVHTLDSITMAKLSEKKEIRLPTAENAKRQLAKIQTTEKFSRSLPPTWFIGNMVLGIFNIDNPIIPNSLSSEFLALGYLGVGFSLLTIIENIKWKEWKSEFDPDQNPQLTSLTDSKNQYHLSHIFEQSIKDNKISLLLHQKDFRITEALEFEIKRIEEIDIQNLNFNELKKLFVKQQLPPYQLDLIFNIHRAKDINLPQAKRSENISTIVITPINHDIQALVDLKLNIPDSKDSLYPYLTISEFQRSMSYKKDLIIYKLSLEKDEDETLGYITLTNHIHPYFGISFTRESKLPRDLKFWQSFITKVFSVEGGIETYN